ncbi:hypothetical protein AAE478_000873 [Parahypoxylon ruwenzoriense]
MLYSIARAAIGRLTSAAAATSSRRIVAANALTHQKLGISRFSYGAIRSFAAAGRPKTSAKAAATKKTVKKTTVAKKTTKTAAKGTAKKPTTAKKATSKTKTAAKPKPRSRQKPLSPEKKAILERKELKKTALFEEPKALPDSHWTIFVMEQTKGKKDSPVGLRERMSQLAEAFRRLPAAEVQRLESVTVDNKITNGEEYKKWVESHTAQDVNNANRARQLLKRKYNFPKGQLKVIRDSRLPKKPTTAFLQFTKSRWASGEFADRKISESAKIIGQEWKKLPDTERLIFRDLAKTDLERYEKEVASVLNRAVFRRPASSRV